MYFILIITFSIATIVLLFNKNNQVYRWYSGFFYSTGLGALAAVIQEQIIPYIPAQYTTFLMIAARTMSFISYCFSPYCILIFSIFHGRVLSPHKQTIVAIDCLFPVFITVIIDFMDVKHSILYKFLDYHPLFWIVTLWATVFVLLSDYYLIKGYWVEKNPHFKLQKLTLLLFTIPITTYGTYTSYIAVAFGSYLWRYNIYLGIFVITGFVLMAIRYGTLGIKINIEESNYKTMKLISSGTSLISHGIKNELARINFSFHFLKQDLSLEEKQKYFDIITGSINHLNDLTAMIHKNTQKITLSCEASSIKEIVKGAVNSIKGAMARHNIEFTEKYRFEPIIDIDKVHITEVLSNILQNAVESIPPDRKGKIAVELYKYDKYAVIKINDNGSGISKENLPHVIEPFFSTKKLQTQNYGLGLTYCYNVMLEHQGFFEIKSRENVGTSIYLSFLL